MLSKDLLKPLKLALCAVCLVVFSACSATTSKRMEPQIFPDHNMSTTGLSAATGAAVGAGLGLIIGSSTSNAGEGFLIGSLSGAAVGGMIGREIELSEESDAEQEEILRRHEEIIDQQKREIKDVRDIGGEEFSSKPKKELIKERETITFLTDDEDVEPHPFAKEDSIQAPRAQLAAPVEDDLKVEDMPVSEITEKSPVIRDSEVRAVSYKTGKAERVYLKAPSGKTEALAALSKKSVEKARKVNKASDAPSFKAPTKSAVKKEAPKPKPIIAKKKVAPAAEEHPFAKKKAKEPIKVASLDTPKKKSADLAGKKAPAVSSLKEETLSLPSTEKAKQAPIKTELPPLEVAKKAEPAKAKKIAKAEPVVKEVKQPEVKKELEKVAEENSQKLAKAEVSEEKPDECASAKREAGRAEKSSSDADKLFYYRRAIRLCPSEAGYHLEIAKVYSSIGRTEDAEYELRQALDLDPSNSEVQDQLTLLQAGE